MSEPKDKAPGPYIVWRDYGCYEGWHPYSYPTIGEAVLCAAQGDVITRKVDYLVVEKASSAPEICP